MCKELARTRRVYRLVEAHELARIAGTVHHGGAVAIAVDQALREPSAQHVAAWVRDGSVVVACDGVGNPHNLGAIARTMAYLGARALIVEDGPGRAGVSDAAMRVSEGGLARIDVFAVRSLPAFLGPLPAEVCVIGTALGAPTTLGRWTPPPGCKLLVLGNEEHGLSPAVAHTCDVLVEIPGTGGMESLNVSVAAAIFLWELLGGPERQGHR
jgi:TrmH RNA methyltransferase